jgi:hypothetical protein
MPRYEIVPCPNVFAAVDRQVDVPRQRLDPLVWFLLTVLGASIQVTPMPNEDTYAVRFKAEFEDQVGRFLSLL